MAAAEPNALGAFLDFLNYSSDTEKDSTLDTPHIDKVLQKYHADQKKQDTSSNLNKVGGAVHRYPSNHGPNDYGDRIVALEHQLTELMKKNENMIMAGPHAAVQTRGGASSDSETGQKENLSKDRERKKSKPKTKKTISSLAEDKRTKSNLKVTPADHTHRTTSTSTREIEEERERRWKAEQAAVRLAEHVHHLQLQVDELKKKLETSVVQRNQLETGIIREKEKIAKLIEENKKLQSHQTDEENEISRLRKRYDDQLMRLKNVEQQLDKTENARSLLYNEMNEKVRESEIKYATSQHELLLQQQIVRKLQQQLQELQELLATREKEHIKELERLDNRNVQNIMEKEIHKERIRCETVIAQHKERFEQQKKAYSDLEDEFRAALRIEAARYQQLETIHEKLTEELAVCRESLTSAKEKDKKSTKIINELSTIVKQQKTHVTELINKQKDILTQFRDKSNQLDTEIATRAKFEERMSSLQQENNELSIKLTAQESLMSGLKEEKKLWSKELAEQGACLAQDRGRLESQIECLKKQVLELHETQQANRTTIKVREKVIEDQTGTIKQLKQEISDLKSKVSSIQSDWTDKFDVTHNELEQERFNVQDLHKQLEIVTIEKLSYEEQLNDIHEGERKWKDKYNKLKGQWEDRVGLIVELENNVKQLQEKGKQREEELLKERDRAQFECRKAMENLESVKIKMQEQTNSLQQVMAEKVQEALKEKQKEIEAASNLRVATVEEEMKQVLSETAKERKAMETKFQRLSKAFQDMQKELD